MNSFNIPTKEQLYATDPALLNNLVRKIRSLLCSSTQSQQAHQFFLENFEFLMNSPIYTKIDLLIDLKEDIKRLFPNQYESFYRWADIVGNNIIYSETVADIFDILLEYRLFDQIDSLAKEYLEKSKSQEVEVLPPGKTSCVFRIGDYVLKLSRSKFTPNCPDQHFRIARRLLHQNLTNKYQDKVLEFEIQQYYANQEAITDEMIYYLFLDLKKDGLELADPFCLQLEYNNFRLLDDYHQANTNNPENLPPYFKKDPLVLIDVDLIFPYQDSSIIRPGWAANYHMDDAIRDYEARMELQKKHM